MLQSIQETIDRYVETMHDEREPDGRWHPSSISGCLRQAIYAARGEPETNPRDARSKRVLRIGHLVHQFVQAAIADAPGTGEFYPEVELSHPELGITGHCDGLYHNGIGCPLGAYCVDGEHWEVLEIKSISSNAFRYKSLPQPKHIVQITAYMKALRENISTPNVATWYHYYGPFDLGPFPTLTRAWLVYVAKDDFKTSEHEILFTPNRETELIRRIDELNRCQANGSLPERLGTEYDKKSKDFKQHWLCGYCPYQDSCWKDEEW